VEGCGGEPPQHGAIRFENETPAATAGVSALTAGCDDRAMNIV